VLEKFERYPLTFGPTPVEKLSRLSGHLGGEVELFAKREDCNSGLAFGGNKVRKLEYIVPDAIAAKADTLVTIGGVQSNHTRQVAAVAAKLGLKCRLVQESWVPFEDAVYDRVGNILMSRVMGADIDLVDEGFDIGIRESWERAIQDVKDRGGRPYAIPAGASVHKYGGLGFVGFAEEVRRSDLQRMAEPEMSLASMHPAHRKKPKLRCWTSRRKPPRWSNWVAKLTSMTLF
jgi:1-aminocyclopropane-1-carboxylate deaminase